MKTFDAIYNFVETNLRGMHLRQHATSAKQHIRKILVRKIGQPAIANGERTVDSRQEELDNTDNTHLLGTWQ